MSLYRLRPLKYILEDPFNELKRQEIYFASFSELNDPQEGFKHILWLGDEIVWKNLLKNYLLSLLSVTSTFLISASKNKINDKYILNFKSVTELPTLKLQEIYHNICSIFFQNKKVRKYPHWLSLRKNPVRRDELLFYLKSIHAHAIYSIFTVLQEYKLMAKLTNSDILKSLAASTLLGHKEFNAINQTEHELTTNFLGRIYSVQNISSQIELKILLANSTLFDEYNKKFIFLDFPEKYLNQIETLLHFECYTSCFLDDYQNTALWGYYADGHKGICLKFKTHPDSNNNPSIKLFGINGWKGGIGNSELTKGIMSNLVYKTNYTNKNLTIDFFRNMGKLSKTVLIRDWYSDEDSNISSCADIFKNEKAWREKYWDTFLTCMTSKSEAWSHENEYRLILQSMFIDSNNSESRKLMYNFNDLEGIIFGTRTPLDKKMEIIKIIEDKCKEANRNDFKYYQAQLCHSSGKIEIEELKIHKSN